MTGAEAAAVGSAKVGLTVKVQTPSTAAGNHSNVEATTDALPLTNMFRRHMSPNG
jgi:hypothetical protein